MCHKWPWQADNIRSIYWLYPVIHCLFTGKTALHNTLKCSVLRGTCLGRNVSWENVSWEKRVLGETCLERNMSWEKMSWEKRVLGETCLGSLINYSQILEDGGVAIITTYIQLHRVWWSPTKHWQGCFSILVEVKRLKPFLCILRGVL